MKENYTIRVSARALIIKDQKLLLVKDRGQTYWYPPGGGIESYETLKEGAIREVHEETGLNIEIGKYVFMYEFFVEKDKLHVFNHCFLGKIIEGEHTSNWQDLDSNCSVEENRFFSLEELKNEKDIFPEFLKEGTWLNDISHDNIYKGVYKFR